MSALKKKVVTWKVLLALTLFFFISSTPTLHSGRTPASLDEKVSVAKKEINQVHLESKNETMKRLKRAQVVIADYDLLKHDFPELASLSNEQIDSWLLDQTAYISIPQTEQTAVNTHIETTELTRNAYRPPHYGRATVFPVKSPENASKDIGLIDVKGTGSLNPAQKSHGNGVATLGEGLREYIYENMIREILHHEKLPNKTVASYAVIYAGFDVIHEDGSKSPAGLYLRQAHNRPNIASAWLDLDTRMRLQKIFRSYGIDPNRNVQGTRNDDLFDFGHYVVKDSLEETNPAKQLDMKIWGYDKSIPLPQDERAARWFYSKYDNAWKWSHELADAFAAGRAGRHDAWVHYQNFMAPLKEHLSNLSTTTCIRDIFHDLTQTSRNLH